MTKIIVQITNQIREVGSNLEVNVKPFEYNGKKITLLEVKKGNASDWQSRAPDGTQSDKHGRAEINLTDDKILGIEGTNTLKIDGENITVDKWEPSDFVFTFEPTRAQEWEQLGSATTIDLTIKERKLDLKADIAPKINKIRIKKSGNENYFNSFFKKNTTYQIRQLNLAYPSYTTAMSIVGEVGDNKILDLSRWPVGLTIEKIGSDNIPINQNQVEEQKVRDAYNEAKTAYSNRQNNLETAIQALKNLLKIGKEGTETEKRKFAEIVTENELDLMKRGLIHNSYEQRKSLPNWEGGNDTSLPPEKGDDTPALWEEENSQIGSIEKYNELYSGRKHSVLVKYNQLHQQIHNNFEQYKDKPLFKQMDEKEATFREFRSIWENDNKNKRLEIKSFNDGELAKREEVIKLMEQLIAESQGDGSDNSKKRKNDDQSDGSNKKSKTVSEIKSEVQNEVTKQDKITANTLADLITEAQSKSDLADLEHLLKEIDNYKGEKGYSEKETEITELKRKLIKLDSKRYQTSVVFDLKDKLEKNGIATSDLDSETQSLITKLENENVSEEEIIQLEKKADEAIGVKNMLNKLEKIIQELETARKSKDNKKSEDKLQELIRFTESTNLYSQKAYEQKKEIVNNLLKDENSQGSPNKDSGFSWIPVLVVGGVLVIGLVGVMVYRSWRRKKERKEI